MADNKMLIDATHPEETRVVVLRGGRVEEFDYESAARKLLRGNIYLAKVTRVEPALQAAFVDYGGNRHGFLAFNEIHPDYYQIPMADRQALIEEEVAAAVRDDEDDVIDDISLDDASTDHDEDDEDEDEDENFEPDDNEIQAAGEDAQYHEHSEEDDRASTDADAQPRTLAEHRASDPTLSEEAPDADAHDVEASDDHQPEETSAQDATHPDYDNNVDAAGSADAGTGIDKQDDEPTSSDPANIPHEVGLVEDQGVEGVNGQDASTDDSDAETDIEIESVEEVGRDDALEEVPQRPRRSRRSYKIQEVIKRRQILLIQVVKEERGTKGAALTTYLSLAGRYTVLMPNTARGGGVSRKISSPQDRKRMKAIASELDVPDGMGLIIRTAGASRTKQEIRRDFEYLLRLWENVRELTLESTAPSLVYEEGDLIKRSIRDLYNKDVDEVIVAGDEAHKEAKAFMKMLMPSHTRNVTLYAGAEPLFTRHQIERQLNAMFTPQVPLRSGGYLVINQTEALVAVDVNSGRSTREFSIEETALHTNLEAAEEVARQLKLRDLAGLIVIDFIDMDEKRNNRAVERRMKDVLRDDRARIQVGRISHFGLLEMSRQRMRTGVLEGSTSPCQHCQGTGTIRSTESVALAVLRGLEDTVMSGSRTPLVTQAPAAVALYILNSKRAFIDDMERRLGHPITIEISDTLVGANFTIEKGSAASTIAKTTSARPPRSVINMDAGFTDEGSPQSTGQRDRKREETRDDPDQPKRRRRRRGRRSRDDANFEDHSEVAADDAEASEAAASEGTEDGDAGEHDAANGDDGSRRRNRRRGRRGGRRNRERRAATETTNGSTMDNADPSSIGADQEPHGQSANDNVTPDGLGPQPDIIHTDPSNGDDGDHSQMSAREGEETTSSRPRRSRRSDRPRKNQTSDAKETDVLTSAVGAGENGEATRDAPKRPEDAPAALLEAANASNEPTTPRRSRAPDTAPEDIQIQSIKVGTSDGNTDREVTTDEVAAKSEEKRSGRTGWWQRRLLGDN